MAKKFYFVKHLSSPPIKRAAYSDRTAWLMAVMSSLAYVRFEQPTPLEELVEVLAKETEKRKIQSRLLALLAAENRDQHKADLMSDLNELGFELVQTFSISIPFVVDTQAFLAKRVRNGKDPMLIIAFRGTEPKKPADIKADLHAEPIEIGLETKRCKVHTGFYKAFKAVEDAIKEELNKPDLQDIPLYIAGHSLGGALAIIATYCLERDSLAACYTFGAPRVGNLAFGQSLKAPVYRVVNASDLVPRLPPSFIIETLSLLVRWLSVLPYREQIADFLDKYRHYRHHGDLRYLTAAIRKEEKDDPTFPHYPRLKVIPNPPQLSRWGWVIRRWLATRGKAAVSDHSIDIYVEKLAHWAITRSNKYQ